MQKETQTRRKTLLGHTWTRSVAACEGPVAAPHQICSGSSKRHTPHHLLIFLGGFTTSVHQLSLEDDLCQDALGQSCDPVPKAA